MARKKKKTPIEMFPGAGLFIGIGIGLIVGSPGPGALIGLGVGMLASIIYIILNKK